MRGKDGAQSEAEVWVPYLRRDTWEAGGNPALVFRRCVVGRFIYSFNQCTLLSAYFVELFSGIGEYGRHNQAVIVTDQSAHTF